MKLSKLNQIGIFLILTIFSACSKQNEQAAAGPNGQSAAEKNSQNQDASISLRNVYSIQVAGGQGAYLITELENTGKVGISAFQGKWTVKDDLDAPLADQEVRFTSDTPYATPEGIKSSHIISPGENFVIIIQAVSGQPDNTFVTTKENIGNIGVVPLTMTLKESKLEDYRVTKKIVFEVDKIVNQ